jgi:hypothetical protein
MRVANLSCMWCSTWQWSDPPCVKNMNISCIKRQWTRGDVIECLEGWECIITYEPTSHQSNIKAWPPYKFYGRSISNALNWTNLESLKPIMCVQSTKNATSGLNASRRLLCWMNDIYAHMQELPLAIWRVCFLYLFNSQRAMEYELGLLHSLEVSYVIFFYGPNLLRFMFTTPTIGEGNRVDSYAKPK